jgi:hypothetical protein
MTHRNPNVTGAIAAALVALAAGLAPASAQAPAANPAAAPAPATSTQPATASQPFDAARLADQALAGVRVRLNLSNDQIVRIKPLLMETMAKLRQSMIGYYSPDGAMFPALVTEFRATRETFRASLEPILSPDQMKEFMVIRREVDQAVRDTVCDARLAEVKPRLALRPDQEQPVRGILCDDLVRKRDLAIDMTTSSGGPVAPVTPTPLYQKIQDETDARLKQVLSAEQMKAYEAYGAELKARAQKPAN